MKRFNQLLKKCTNYMQNESKNGSGSSRFASLSILSRQSVLTIFCLLLLGTGQVWGWNSISSGKRLYYFNNSSDNWNAVWIHIWKDSETWDYGLTQVGSTSYWYYDSGNGWNEISGFDFYKVNHHGDSKTSSIYGNVSNSTVFIRNSDWSNVFWETSYFYVSPSGGATVYFDNTDFGFTADKIYFRAGFGECNEAFLMSKVDGTSNLYKIVLPNSYPYGAYTISQKNGYTNLNSIYNVGGNDAGGDYHIAKQLVYKRSDANITGDFTIYYKELGDNNDTENCQYYNYYTFSGHTRNVSITEHTGGTITVSYKDESNADQSFTSGTTAVAQTCKIKANPVAARGYTYRASSLQIGGATYTENTDYIVRGAVSVSAIFDPKSYTTVNLNNGSGTGSSTIGSTVTTGSAYPSVTPPVLNGFHFMGYYSATSGGGTKYYNEDGTPTEDAWFVDANTDVATPTLYAYYVTPTISSLTFAPERVLPVGEVKLTPEFDYNPEGTYSFCYKLTIGTSPFTAMQVQPTFTATGVNPGEVTFEAPSTPGAYAVEVELYSGSSPDCSSVGIASLKDHADQFTVEAANAVTVKYQCNKVDIRPSTIVYATAEQSAATVTAPTIAGLEFTGWTLGANVTRVGGADDNVNPITINASDASTLTANYSQSGYVYFKNTLGWEHVYLYTYNNQSYWSEGTNGDYGTGSHGNFDLWTDYCTAAHLEMSLVSGTTDLYCYKANLTSGKGYAFTNRASDEYFFGRADVDQTIECVYVNTDFNAKYPMIVPNVDGNTTLYYSNRAKYYRNYFIAPILVDWGWTLRGDWDGVSGNWLNKDMWYKFTASSMGSITFQTERYCDIANFDHHIQVYDSLGTGRGKTGTWVIDGTTSTPTEITTGSDLNMTFTTNYPGEYYYTLSFEHSNNQVGGFAGKIKFNIIYPVVVGDFRLVYTGGSHPHPGNIIKQRENGKDTVSMYVAAGQSSALQIQPCTAVASNSITWGALNDAEECPSLSYAVGVDFASILSDGGAGVYNFIIEQDENGENPIVTKVEKYSGHFYVRTDCIDDKWEYWKSKDKHVMTYSDFSISTALAEDKRFSHYYVKDVNSGTNIKFTVANDYSEAITDTVVNGDADGSWKDYYGNVSLDHKLNVRFSYNQNTNKIWRAYTEGPQLDDYMVLRFSAGTVYKAGDTELTNPKKSERVSVKFDDLGNWVYQADVMAKVNSFIKLTADVKYHGYTAGDIPRQNLKGKSGTGDDTEEYTSDDAVILLGGSGTDQHMRITYDFKTDRMITSWLPPEEGNITGNLELYADVMLIRSHQDEAQSITFTAGDGNKLTHVKTVYGVMQFDKTTLNDPTVSRYKRDLFWISFPFDVKLREVFGFGTYGTHWIIERYDGISRAKHGFWADSPSNWKFITPYQCDSGWVLKANEGYILALDLDELTTSSHVWDNSITTIFLYFPSTAELGTIQATSKDVEFSNQSEYKCTINRGTAEGDRRIKDSYWHCIGVPSFAGAGHQITSAAIPDPIPGTSDQDSWTAGIPFVYTWNSTDNSLSVNTSGSMTFDAMYSYLVQYSGAELKWENVTNKVAGVAARLVETPDREYNLQLMLDNEEQDHTYVRLTDDANVTNRFEFNYDLSKEYNAGKGNIWTVTADTVEVAGNSMPKPVQTTVVPVGVKVVANGEYTLSMPEGTNGEDVYLIDNAYGTRTNLGLMPYTVTLTAGTYDSRFALEFAPIQDSPTSLENDANANANANADVRKVFVGGRLYIIRDGKVYDAAGQRIE